MTETTYYEKVELIETDHAVNIDSVQVKSGGDITAQLLPTEEPLLKVAREVATRCEVTLTRFTLDGRVRFET
jgi:hypothetical protein